MRETRGGNTQRLLGTPSLFVTAHFQQCAMNDTALVIGNDGTIVDFVACVLERANIDVLHAANGYLGIKMMLAHVPDVVLSCHHMPYCTGLDVLKTVRAHHRTQDIPFISMFPSPNTTLPLQHRLSGTDAALTSPFAPERVMNTVYDLLKKASRSVEAHL